MDVNDGSLASCAFSIAPGNESGAWLESPTGTYARVGQAISQSGIPGGDYIVAAKVNDASPAPCVESVGMDTAGWIDGRQRSCTEELRRRGSAVSRGTRSPVWVCCSARELCRSGSVHLDPGPSGRRLPGEVVSPVRQWPGRHVLLHRDGGRAERHQWHRARRVWPVPTAERRGSVTTSRMEATKCQAPSGPRPEAFPPPAASTPDRRSPGAR